MSTPIFPRRESREYTLLLRQLMIVDCPYPAVSGLEDIEQVNGYCEVGCECYRQCSYSWNSDEEQKVNKIFENFK